MSKTPDEFKHLVAFGITKPWIDREGYFKDYLGSKGYQPDSNFVRSFEYLETNLKPISRSNNWVFTAYSDGGQLAGDLVKMRVATVVWQKTNNKYRFQEVEVFYPSDEERYNVDGFLCVLWPALEEDAKNLTILRTKKALESDSSIEKQPAYLHSSQLEYRDLADILKHGRGVNVWLQD